MQGEHCLRGDRGSWTERSTGETRGREERLRGRGQLRGWTATPRDLIRAMPAKGDHPAGGFFSARAAARSVQGKDRYPYSDAQRGAWRVPEDQVDPGSVDGWVQPGAPETGNRQAQGLPGWLEFAPARGPFTDDVGVAGWDPGAGMGMCLVCDAAGRYRRSVQSEEFPVVIALAVSLGACLAVWQEAGYG
jgi:hypothetical protein